MQSTDDKITLNPYERWHMRHRMFRYRFKSERPSISFVLGCDLAGKTLVDVGANYGIYSCYFSKKAGADGAVIAFEPQPELNDHLVRMRNSFGLENLTVVNKGLSSENSRLRMSRPFAGSGAAGVNLPDGMFGEEFEVEVMTLDGYLGTVERKAIAFMKADVQGHEYDVFRGARGVLEQDKPTLLFELYDYEAESGEVFSMLTGLGYVGWFYYVQPSDHASIFRSGRGKYIEFQEFDKYENVRPSVNFRNYLFAHKNSREAAALRRVVGIPRVSAAIDIAAQAPANETIHR